MQKEVKRVKPKTKKQIAFVKALPSAISMTEAATIAGYKDPGQAAYENKKKLDMSDYFNKSGLTLEAIAENTTRIALTAKKIVGTSNDFIEVEDNQAQLAAMKYSTDLRGLNKENNGQLFVQVNNVVNTKKEDYGL